MIRPKISDVSWTAALYRRFFSFFCFFVWPGLHPKGHSASQLGSKKAAEKRRSPNHCLFQV
jgi:hypothetical protein